MIDAFCLSAALVIAFQNPPPPPSPAPPIRASRDPVAEKKGTSVIKGHVFSPDGRPLRRVQIRITSSALSDPRTTTTGIEGEYELRDLPAGRYVVHATRSGYLAAQHGQAAFGEPGKPIELAENATIEKIDFIMARAGVVSGRVTDEAGDAVAGVDIYTMQQQFFRGRKRLVPVFASKTVHVSTDDSGQYRFTGLAPGEYVIMGRLRDTWMSDEKEPQMLSYAPTYFTGTADPAEARRVKVVSGQESGAVDFMLVPVRAAVISGTVVGANGAPLTSGRVMLGQELWGPAGGTTSSFGSSVIGADGSWQVRDVAPGEYIIRANGSTADGGPEAASLPLIVNGTDLEGIVVSADAGALIAGRLVTDTGEPLPGPSLTVTTGPVSMDSRAIRPTPGRDDGVVGADGGFALKGPSGQVILRVNRLPAGWAIASVMIGGRDYAGLPIDLRPGQTLGDITVVITHSLPTLTGRMLGVDAKPAEGTVLLFPTDPARWLEAAGNVRIARSDQSGNYRFESVRPGEYFAIALASMQQWQMNDPDFLNEQKARALKIAITGSQPEPLDLKVVR